MRAYDCRLTTVGLVTLVTGCAAAFVIVCALYSALPKGLLDVPFLRDVNIRLWLPEGWAFFTADAQAEVRTPWARDGAHWVVATQGPYARMDNLFGLQRRAGVQDLEIDQLLEQVPDDRWRVCDKDASECLAQLPQPEFARNTSLGPSLCGDVAIIVRKPVPWAWRSLTSNFSMPARVVRLEVKC